MRQLIVRVPQGHGQQVLDIAKKHNAVNVAQLSADSENGAVDVVLTNVSNRQAGKMLKNLQHLPDLHLSWLPQPIIALKPPPSETPDQVIQVQPRSPIEVFLHSLQSIGSWKGFLGYAASAGVVVWIGLFTNTIYLLIAAMLIAPFAGPAMNVAIASAVGYSHLFKRSLLRYFGALAVTALVTGSLTLLLPLATPTNLMVDVSQVSAVSVVLPLIAGAAGALNLIQSERSSLVPGTAVGLLVAASLAPPIGVVGMAAALGKWSMVGNSAFVLLLQLVGINLGGAVVFRLYGLSTDVARYGRGKSWMSRAMLGGTLVLLIALLAWQFSDPVSLQRASLSQRMGDDIRTVVEQSDVAELIEVNARFTAPNVQGQNTLLAVVFVQPTAGVSLSSPELEQQLQQTIGAYLLERGYAVTPLIQVNVVKPPD